MQEEWKQRKAIISHSTETIFLPKAHGGALTVNLQEGEYAEFVVQLPI